MHHFSQESEVLTSQQNGLDGTTYSIANGKSFPVKSLSTISPTPNNMKTSKTSTQMSIEDELMFSAEDSHVNHLASQENERDQKMNATCGRRCLELSESVNPVGSWARTFAGLLVGRTDWFSKRCSLTWKLSGTPSNRLLFQLVPQAHHTDVTEFGLLHTPTTYEAISRKNPRNSRGEPKLEQQARNLVGLLLTPTTREEVMDMDKFKTRMEKYDNGTTVPNLATQIHGMLPTPIAQAERANASIDRGKGNLSHEVATRFEIGGKSSQLSPLFVEEMMGFPKNWTALPFQSGEENLSKPMETL